MRRPLHTPEPTPAALRQAWGRMTSPARPPTLEAALAHPVWGICVRAAARELLATHWPQVRPHPAHTAATRAIRRTILRAAPVDLKRRAANDLDD